MCERERERRPSRSAGVSHLWLTHVHLYTSDEVVVVVVVSVYRATACGWVGRTDHVPVTCMTPCHAMLPISGTLARAGGRSGWHALPACLPACLLNKGGYKVDDPPQKELEILTSQTFSFLFFIIIIIFYFDRGPSR